MAQSREILNDLNKDLAELKQSYSVLKSYSERDNANQDKSNKLLENVERRLINLIDKAKENKCERWLVENQEPLEEYQAFVSITKNENTTSKKEGSSTPSKKSNELNAYINELINKPLNKESSIQLADMIHKHGINLALKLYLHLQTSKKKSQSIAEKIKQLDEDMPTYLTKKKPLSDRTIKDLLSAFPKKDSLETLADLIVSHQSQTSIAIYQYILKKNPDSALMEKLGDIYYDEENYVEALEIYHQANKLKPFNQFEEKKNKAAKKCEPLQREACKAGRIEDVKKLMALGVRSDQLIIEAVKSADIKILHFVIEQNFPVDAVDSNKWNAAHWAAYNNYLTMIQSLYSSHPAIFNAMTGKGLMNGGESVLTVAARYNANNVANFLIAKKCHLNDRDQSGWTALRWAYYNKNEDLFKALLAGHVDTNVPSNAGSTALHVACRDNRVDAVRDLINAGADYNLKDEKGQTALDIASYNAKDGVFFSGSPKAREIVEIIRHAAQTKRPAFVL